MSTEPTLGGGARWLANACAVVAYSALGFLILPRLDINPWWSPFTGLIVLATLSAAAALAGYLSRAAGAAFVRRTEAEKLAIVGPELDLEDLEKLQEKWQAEFTGHGAAFQNQAGEETTTSAPGGDA